MAWHIRTLTIGTTNDDLENLAIAIDRATGLAFVDDVGSVEGAAVETTGYQSVGRGVGAVGSGLHAGAALEEDVDWRRKY
jgi:hypothetical protein